MIVKTLGAFELVVEETLEALLLQEDKNGDKRIDNKDTEGKKEFLLQSTSGEEFLVKGNYHLSNLLEELFIAKELGKDNLYLTDKMLYENPVDRINRYIKELYWDGLSRKVSAENLFSILNDSKNVKDCQYLYIPEKDEIAWKFYRELVESHEEKIELRAVPEKPTLEFYKSIKGEHGFLSLKIVEDEEKNLHPVEYIVPGGRFNEMYGWDTIFGVLGLLGDHKHDRAKHTLENLMYEIEHYGRILNANRSYYLMRSQPPMLTIAAFLCYRELPHSGDNIQWVKNLLVTAEEEYETVWMKKGRYVPEIHLNTYGGMSYKIPPEVEDGHFDHIIEPYAKKAGLSIKDYSSKYMSEELDEPALDEFFRHDVALRESGHDTTYRWNVDGKDQCANFATVDLNCLLYRYEIDFYGFYKNIFRDKEKAELWRKRAERRKEAIFKYLYNEEDGCFYDYNYVIEKQSTFLSATTLYPLIGSSQYAMRLHLLNRKQVDRLIENGLAKLEQKGGIASTTQESIAHIPENFPERQWDFPYGWAPHQILVWGGLFNYRKDDIADRLIYKWLYMIVTNFMESGGAIAEKYDVVNATLDFQVEYGNEGTSFEYFNQEGFGWTNSSFKFGWSMLSKKYHKHITKMVPPEVVFGEDY